MDDKAKFYWNPYLVWQKAQGIPIHTGFFVEDARKVPVEFWQARNANGAFINLAAAQFNDAYVLEIPPRERTTPRRQLFDEITIVIGGQGATTYGTTSTIRNLSSGKKDRLSRFRPMSGTSITP